MLDLGFDMLMKGALLGCSGYTVIFLVCTRLLLQVFGRKMSSSGYIRATRNLEDVVNVCWYGALSYVGIYRFDLHKAWFNSGYRYEADEGRPNLAAMAICGLQIGGYFAMSFLIWFSPRKRDVFTMISHHIVTLSVVLLCVFGGYAHACTSILLLHDICDVPLLFMTLAGRNNWKFLEVASYCCTVATFLAARILAFPFLTAAAVVGNPQQAAFAIVPLNCILWGMHVYWLGLLLRQGYRRLKGLSTYDPREEPTPERETTSTAAVVEETNAVEETEPKEEIEPEEEPIAYRLRKRVKKIN